MAIAILALTAASARADEPLRWNFQDGQRLAYSVVQEMTISGTAGPAGDLKNTTRQQMDIAWEVQSVNDAGDAVVRHRFERIRSQMTLPTGGLEFDSAAEGPPTGMAAIGDLAPPEAFQTLFLPGFPVLPDGAVEPGQKWSTKIAAELPMAGRLHSTTMKHAATIETTAGDRRTEQKIELIIEVKPRPPR